MKIQTHLRILAALLLVSMPVQAFAPNDFLRPYDPVLRLSSSLKTPFKVGVNVEGGLGNDGKDINGHRVNILRVYEPTQAYLPALYEAQNAAVTAHLATFDKSALDDGIRGHVQLRGKLEMADITPNASWTLELPGLPGKFGVSVAVPVRHAAVKAITFNDVTSNVLPGDLQIRADIHTEAALKNTLKTYGGPDLEPWSKTGLGDMTVVLDWSNSYEQKKDSLENVELLARVGLSIPTAEKRNEDKAFSLALGNDGAWSMPFGMGMNLDFKHTVRLTAEAQFDILFNTTKLYRMKTHDAKTRFFLLNKGRATKEHGFTWKFNLGLMSYHFWQGCTVGVNYHYFKHDDDRLVTKGDDFDSSILNGARWLKEYTAHHFIFKANWDGSGIKAFDKITPQVSLFYKLPVEGKCVMMPHTLGGQLAINF